MLKRLHAIAGGVALLLIILFWMSSFAVEVFGNSASIIVVKAAILWGMLALVPALAIAGASGMILGQGWKSRLVARKQRRMRIVAANGLTILLPSAFFLALRAGDPDGWFYAVQVLESAAGAVNVTLLGLNMRDGLALGRPAFR
ncbi:hypothetical protein [Labrenzia sp. 011]|uniref:hypothetical protein n=1 Tax=Labrenzia sp. 011 TaxID=2171494 RepID=UPI000D50876D|nr:hypothetical protein [Labrenzia sp. 011]PVB63074.1 hypothetical protein DCO57_04180 [Labrenzia sp. 011]